MQKPLSAPGFKTKMVVILVICCFAVIQFKQTAKAGAWPVRKGKFITSLTFSSFTANSKWDSIGRLSDYPGGGYFKSQGIALYTEYGISRRVTGILSLPYVFNQVKQNDVSYSQKGFSDAEVGLRFYLTNIKFKYYLALQATTIVPLYKASTLGFGSNGGDLGLVFSGSGKSYYFNLQADGRQYFSATGPTQVRYTGTFGLNIDKHDQFSVGASGVWSTSINKTFSANIVQNQDFSYTQVSASYGYIFNTNTSLFATVNQFVVGRNTGMGTNIALSISQRF